MRSARGRNLLPVPTATDLGRAYAPGAAGARRGYYADRLDMEALQPVLAGEIPLVAAVHRPSDIRRVMRLADTGILVIIDPLDNLPRRLETLHSTLENPARLHAPGARFGFATGSTHNARNLIQAAGNAMVHGLPPDAALAALTCEPAEIFGIAADHGSLEPGRVADLVLLDGDPLEVTNYPDRALNGGRESPRESRQTRLRDRYL